MEMFNSKRKEKKQKNNDVLHCYTDEMAILTDQNVRTRVKWPLKLSKKF